MINRLRQDLRVALRGFRRAPTFVVTAVLILGLGIGMATAMWSVVHGVLWRPLPIPDADRVIVPRAMDQSGIEGGLDLVDIDQIRHESRTMIAIAGYAFNGAQVHPLMDGDQTLALAGTPAQWQFFDVLGVRPALGRLFGPHDDSTSHVMVLSYDAWQRYFGGDPHVLGHRFREPVTQTNYTVVGVAPPGIDWPAGTDYWSPLRFPQGLKVVARLAPNATIAMARTEFRAIIDERIKAQKWEGSQGTPMVPTFNVAVVGDVRPTLIFLTVAVGLLLLIVCVNLGNLSLLRTAARARELAVRRAIGATYGDVVQQLIVESALIGVFGGALGLGAGELGRRALIAAAPASLPRLDMIRASGTPVVAALVIALICVTLFGVVPALFAMSGNPATLLRLDARSGSATRRRRRFRQTLVASQIALALILLAGAGLLGRSLQRLQSIDLGLRPEHLSVLSFSWPFARYPDQAHREALYGQLAPRLHAIPGVTTVTPTLMPPLIGTGLLASPWQSDAETPEAVAHEGMINYDGIGPEYFRTLGVPILCGRGFLDSDDRRSTPVIVVSASVARRYWPGKDPIGRRIRAGSDSVWWTVVGVAGDTHWRTLRESTPMIYLPYRQLFSSGYVALRSSTSLPALLPSIRAAVREVDPTVTLWTAKTMDDYLAKPLAQPRLSAFLLSTLGFVALLLAAIGLYGVMASAVREQRRDIGVRMALGASPGRVRAEVLRRAALVAFAGAGVGFVAALSASRLVSALLFETSPADPVALFGACTTLLAVAFAAAFVPAWRASRVDPARVLQSD